MAKLSKKKVRLAIPNTFGVRSVIAQKCGVSRSALHKFLKKTINEDLVKEIELEKEYMKDVGENQLGSAMIRGEKWAVKFFLERKARDRGYGFRQEIQHSGEVNSGKSVSELLAEIKQKEKEQKEQLEKADEKVDGYE